MLRWQVWLYVSRVLLCVLRAGGETIRDICRQSGAHVELNRDQSANSLERVFRISGMPDQMQLAMRLISEKAGIVSDVYWCWYAFDSVTSTVHIGPRKQNDRSKGQFLAWVLVKSLWQKLNIDSEMFVHKTVDDKLSVTGLSLLTDLTTMTQLINILYCMMMYWWS